MKTINDIISAVRPDLPKEISQQISTIVESMAENNVDPSLTAMNISFLAKLYDENKEIVFSNESDRMTHKRIRFRVPYHELDALNHFGNAEVALENSLINECVGTINLLIDETGKKTLCSKAPIDRIWKEEFEDRLELNVMLNYELK